MSGYAHLGREERDQIAALRSNGFGIRAIARELKRSASTISREVRRNGCDGGSYRSHVADGGYMLRRQRPARLEQDAGLAACVIDRLTEGWAPEQIAGRLKLGIEKNLAAISTEAIYAWIYRRAQKSLKLWKYLPRRRARRRPMAARMSKDRIADKVHISERSNAADTRSEPGHWEADPVICRHSRPVLVLHERRSRLTLMTRMAGKTAAETISALTAILKRLSPDMRGSVTFDNGTCFARHQLLRGRLSATSYFCDACASWQKGGVENANGRIRRWLPRGTDLEEVEEQEIQEIAMTINLTPRKCLGYKSPVEAFLADLGKDVQIRFAS